MGQVSSSIAGTYVRTITTKRTSCNRGVAVSSDGRLLSVANWRACRVSTYDVATGKSIASFGSKETLNRPMKLCFTTPRCVCVCVCEHIRLLTYWVGVLGC